MQHTQSTDKTEPSNDHHALNANGNGHSPIPPFNPNATGPDPFDLVSLRLSQDFAASLGVKKALLTVSPCESRRMNGSCKSIRTKAIAFKHACWN